MLKYLQLKWEGVKKRIRSKDDIKEGKDEEVPQVPEKPEGFVIYRANHHEIPSTSNENDVILEVDGESFKLHRNVLAAPSKFFQVMFSTDMKEREMKKIQLKGIESCVFQTLIQFMYTGEIKISVANAEKLWITSDYLEIIFVRNAAENFLTEQLMMEIRSEKNNRSFYDVLEIREKANLLQCNQLSVAANKFIAFNLKDFMNTDEFLAMNLDQFLDLIKNDDLVVHCTKETTLKACLSWIEHDKEERMCQKEEIHALINSREHNPRKIFVFGRVLSMEIYDLIKEEWKTGEDSPWHLFDKSVAVVKDRIYFIGGSTFKYQVNKKWSKKKKMLDTRSSAAVAVLEDTIYVCGGFHNFVYNYPVVASVECYDSTRNIWKSLAPMIECRDSACAVALNGFIYVLGGSQNGIEAMNSVERFDSKKNCWVLVKPMIHKRRDFGATVFQGKIYVAGGVDDTFHILSSVEIYDPNEDSWVLAPSMNSKRAFFALLSAGKLFAIGGRSFFDRSFIKDQYLDSVEIFDPKTNLWKFGESMLTKRYNHFAAVVP